MNCPCCGKELCMASSAIEGKQTVHLWCGHGPCPSYAMNDGAEAPTAEEAFDRLETLWQVERDV